VHPPPRLTPIFFILIILASLAPVDTYIAYADLEGQSLYVDQQRNPGAIDKILEGIRNATAGFFDVMGKFFKGVWDFVTGLVNFIVASVQYAGGMFTAIGEGWKTFTGFLGNWGDPDKYFDVMLRAIDKPFAREAIGNCTTGIGSPYSVKALRLGDSDKNICEYLNEAAPTGILGQIHWIVWGAAKNAQIMGFLAKNLVYLLAAVSIFLLVMGLDESIKKKSIEPLIRVIEVIYRIYAFIFKIIIKIIEFIVHAIQSIAQFIRSLIPI